MNMKQHNKYDVLVIGSGIGGLCTAALLAKKGYRTLVVERLPLPGGRCSTIDYKGFKITTGLIGIPMAGVLGGILEEVGAHIDVRLLVDLPARFVIDGQTIDPKSSGSLDSFRGLMMQVCRDEGELNRIFEAMNRADTWEAPSNEISLRDWLLQFTTNENVLSIFHDMGTKFLAASIQELSAREFFLCRRGLLRGFARVGMPPGGSIVLPEALAEVVKQKGGDVWLGCPAKQILVDDGVVKGAIIEKPEGEVEIEASVVVSNAGPKQTVALAGREKFPDPGYLSEVDNMKPSFQGWLTAVSDKPLSDDAFIICYRGHGILTVNFATYLCPELAPPGKHMMLSLFGPDSQAGNWDLKAEVDAHVEAVKELIPNFDKDAEILHVGCYKGEWPLGRNTPFVGFKPLSQKTPIANLYNVGDGVGPEGWSHVSEGCAMTARIVAEDVQKRLKPG
ncbi:phytoene desaturase family protein [Chloroflexota bacterium]